VQRGSVRLGVPPLQIHELFSDEEMMALASSQGVEYRISVLHVAF
jgi:hypothetical protein